MSQLGTSPRTGSKASLALLEGKLKSKCASVDHYCKNRRWVPFTLNREKDASCRYIYRDPRADELGPASPQHSNSRMNSIFSGTDIMYYLGRAGKSTITCSFCITPQNVVTSCPYNITITKTIKTWKVLHKVASQALNSQRPSKLRWISMVIVSRINVACWSFLLLTRKFLATGSGAGGRGGDIGSYNHNSTSHANSHNDNSVWHRSGGSSFEYLYRSPNIIYFRRQLLRSHW